MKVTALLFSLLSLASTKRLTRSGFYTAPSTQYIHPLDGYYSSQSGYNFGTSAGASVKPIFEPPLSITRAYQQPVVSTTPLPVISSTQSPFIDDYDNYISITESTRPKYFGNNQYDQVSYVPSSVAPYAVSTKYITPSVPAYNVNQYVPHYAGNAAAYNGIYNYAPAFYNYQYGVKAPEYGVDFGHQEARQGDVTQGSYHVLLPDGRLQIVEYTADSTGYHPRIRYVYVGAAGLNRYY